jgi:hypothetical protein
VLKADVSEVFLKLSAITTANFKQHTTIKHIVLILEWGYPMAR